ncbi:MAG: hypothetical protein HKL88_06065 [Bacteroidia bacterium]|nr:hypothetical protein [Bacteroidia bacterium]
MDLDTDKTEPAQPANTPANINTMGVGMLGTFTYPTIQIGLLNIRNPLLLPKKLIRLLNLHNPLIPLQT